MKGSKKSVILKTVGICAVAGVVVAGAVLVPVLVLNKKKGNEEQGVLTYGDVKVATNSSTATLTGKDGQVIKNGDNDAMFLTTENGIFGSNLSAEVSYTVTNPNFTPKKGTSSYFMRAKLVYYGVTNGEREEVNPDDYFEVKPEFSTSWLESKDGYFYNVNANEGTWAKTENVSKLHINQATAEADGEGVYLFNNNPTYTVKSVEVEYDILAVEVKIEAVDSLDQTDASLNELGWRFENLLVEDLNLIFDVAGGTAVATVPGNTEEDVVSLANYTTTREGYTFGGWSLTADGDAVTSVTFDKEDITVHALWTINQYNLTYNLDGGEGNIPQTQHDYQSTVTLSNVVPTKLGYTFGGWLLGDEVVTEVTFGAANITVKAKWVAIDYTLTYDLDEGEGDIADTGVHHIGDVVTLTSAVPTKEGYTFVGWTLDGNSIVTNVTFGAENITVTAKWIKNLTLALNLGDEIVALETVYHQGDTVVLSTLDTPTKEGYTFDYWTLNGQTVTSVTFESDEGIVITAEWKKNLYVRYALNGGQGEVVDSTVYFEGSTFTFVETEPTRTNYNFVGWSFDGVNVIDENEYDFTFHSNEDILFNAVWEYYPTIGVRIHELEDYFDETYEEIEGRNEEEENKYQLTVSLPTEEREGYRLRFAVDSADGTLLSADATTYTAVGRVVDLYPVWEKATSVTFVVEGADNEDENGTTTTHSFSSVGNNIYFPSPYASGKVLYWEDEDGNIYQSSYLQITTENYQTDITLTARWSESFGVYYYVGSSSYNTTELATTFKLPTRQMVNTSLGITSVQGWRVVKAFNTFTVSSVDADNNTVRLAHTEGNETYEVDSGVYYGELYKDAGFTTYYSDISEVQVGDEVYTNGDYDALSQTVYEGGQAFNLTEDTNFKAVILENVSFDYGSSNYVLHTDYSYNPVVTVSGEQLVMPENTFGVTDYTVGFSGYDSNGNYYSYSALVYFTGWAKNGNTETLYQPGELVDYQSGDQFSAQYAARKMTIDLDGGEISSWSQRAFGITNSTYIEFTISQGAVDTKVEDGKTYKIGGWEVESDIDEEFDITLDYRTVTVKTKSGDYIQSKDLTLRPIWVELGTYEIEFECDEDVTIIDKATGEAPVITYTVNQNNASNEGRNFYNCFVTDVDIDITGKEGYLPVLSLYTKTGHLIYKATMWSLGGMGGLNDLNPLSQTAAEGNFLAVPGGLVVKVDFEKAYDLEIRKGNIEYVDSETGETVKVEIPGEVIHLKHSAHFPVSYAIMGNTTQYQVEGWSQTATFSGSDGTRINGVYSYATGEEITSDRGYEGDVYYVCEWVNVGVNPGSVTIDGEEVKAQFTKPYLVILRNGTGGISNWNPIASLAGTGLDIAEIPGHPEYKIAGFEFNGKSYDGMISQYSGYILLSGTDEDGTRLSLKPAIMGDSTRLYQVYEAGEKVKEYQYKTTSSNIYLADENEANGYRTISATRLYYTDENNNQVTFAYQYNNRYYGLADLETTGTYAKQTLNFSEGLTFYGKDYDSESGMYFIELANGDRIYRSSYTDNYSGNHYYLENGKEYSTENLVTLNQTDLGYSINNNYRVYKYTMQVEDEEVVVGYTIGDWSNDNAYRFATGLIDDVTTPIIVDLGEGVATDAWTYDVLGKSFNLVWVKTYDIADGEGYSYGQTATSEELAKYQEIVEFAQEKINETLLPGAYNDLSNMTVTCEGIDVYSSGSNPITDGEYTYEEFIALSSSSDLQTIFNPGVALYNLYRQYASQYGATVKANYLEDENIIVLQGKSLVQDQQFVLHLDENGHLVKYDYNMGVLAYIIKINVKVSFTFNNVEYLEPAEMTEEITEEDAEFADTLETLETDTFNTFTGAEVTAVEELSNDLLDQYVMLNQDEEFEYTYQSMWFSNTIVTNVDTENEKVTIKRTTNNLDFYATIDASYVIDNNSSVTTIDDIEIGTQYYVGGHSFDATATKIISKYSTNVRVTSVDTGNGTLTLSANITVSGNNYTFTLTTTLDDIEGLLTFNEVNLIAVSGAVDTSSSGGGNYVQVVNDDKPSDLQLPSALLADEDFVEKEMTTLSYSEDETEYRVHFEGVKAQQYELSITEVDVENQTATISFQNQLFATVGADSLAGIDVITADLVGQKVVLAKDVEFAVEGTEQGEELNEVPWTISRVDTDNQTMVLYYGMSQGGQTMKVELEVGLDDVTGIEEITEDLVGTSVTNVLISNQDYTYKQMLTMPANRITADYVFIYNENGELVKYSMDKYESTVHTQGLKLVLIQSEEETVEP